MKILSIAGQNIASLKDKFFVEFYNGSLKNAGLFSISGKTGAGKSTLFDAMCLALFAQTPRLNSNRGKVFLTHEENDEQNIFYRKFDLNDPLQIITRGETNAFAEVHFEVKGIRYKARWEITKKRKNLEHEQRFYEMREDNSEIEYITDTHTQRGKQKDILVKIENVLGLSFDQFKRAVLLAQGEFAQFLKSNTNEKSELLEKITGSEVYTSVAKKAHEEFKKVKEKKNDLEQKKSGLNIKKEDELKELSHLIEQLHNNSLLLEKSQEEWKKHKLWHETKNELLQKIKAYETQISTIKLEEDKILEQDIILQKVKKSQPLKPYFDQIEIQKKNLKGQEDKLTGEKNSQFVLENQFRNTEKKEAACKESLHRFLEEKPKIEDCISDCELLDEKKSVCAESLEKEHRNLLQYTKEIQNCQKVVQELEDKIDKNHKALTEFEKWLQENSYIEKIKTNKESIFEHADRLIKKYQDIEKFGIAIDFSRPREQEKELCVLKLESLQENIKEIKIQLSQIQQEEKNKNIDDEINRLQEKITHLERLEEDKKYILEKLNEGMEGEKELQLAADKLRCVEDDFELIEKKIEKQDQEIDLLTQDISNMVVASDIASRRHLLKKGEECPLCGSREHPLVNSSSSFSEVLEKLTQQKNEQERQLHSNKLTKKKMEAHKVELLKLFSTQEQKIKSLKTYTEERLKNIHKHIEKLNEPNLSPVVQWEDLLNLNIKSIFDQFCLSLKIQKEIKKKISVLEKNLKNNLEAEYKYKELVNSLETIIQCEDYIKENISHKKYSLENILKRKEKFKENINKIVFDLEEKNTLVHKIKNEQDEMKSQFVSRTAELSEKEKQKENLVQTIEKIKKEFTEISSQRKILLHIEDTKTYKKQFREKEILLKRNFDEIAKILQAEEKSLHQSRTTIDLLEKNLKNDLENLNQCESQYLKKLIEHGFENNEQIRSLFEQDEKWIMQTEKNISNFNHELAKLNTLLQKIEIDYQEHKNQKQNEFTYEEVQEKITHTKQEHNENQIKIGELRQILSSDEEQRKKWEELENELHQIEPTYKLQEKMIKIIGDANGKSFRTFAQNITLDILLSRANCHLSELRPRYKLERIPNADMEIRIVDLFMGNEFRSVNSLSGGESFLVSLALALALSSLSSKNIHMESLFIDEGFGTLDAETLDTAISILDGLQAQGRKVGIISHVESLNEKIGYQIMVKEKGGGYSQVVV